MLQRAVVAVAVLCCRSRVQRAVAALPVARARRRPSPRRARRCRGRRPAPLCRHVKLHNPAQRATRGAWIPGGCAGRASSSKRPHGRGAPRRCSCCASGAALAHHARTAAAQGFPRAGAAARSRARGCPKVPNWGAPGQRPTGSSRPMEVSSFIVRGGERQKTPAPCARALGSRFLAIRPLHPVTSGVTVPDVTPGVTPRARDNVRAGRDNVGADPVVQLARDNPSADPVVHTDPVVPIAPTANLNPWGSRGLLAGRSRAARGGSRVGARRPASARAHIPLDGRQPRSGRSLRG